MLGVIQKLRQTCGGSKKLKRAEKTLKKAQAEQKEVQNVQQALLVRHNNLNLAEVLSRLIQKLRRTYNGSKKLNKKTVKTPKKA